MVRGPQPNIGVGWSSTGGRGAAWGSVDKQGPGGPGGGTQPASGTPGAVSRAGAGGEARAVVDAGCESWGRRGGAPWWACAPHLCRAAHVCPGSVRRGWTDAACGPSVAGRAAQAAGTAGHTGQPLYGRTPGSGSFTGLVGPLTQGDRGPLQPCTHGWTDVSPWGWAGGPALGRLAGAPPTRASSALPAADP